MTDTLEARIRRRLEFRRSEMGNEAVGCIADLPRSWDETSKFAHSCGFGDGARWQHAELTRELEPLFIEMAEAFRSVEMNYLQGHLNATSCDQCGDKVYSAIDKLKAWLSTEGK